MFNADPIIKSLGLAINAESNLRCGDFLSEKIYRHSAGGLSFFLVLTTKHSLNFHKFERQSYLFGVDIAFLATIFRVINALGMC